jgi:hypothetical protein
VPSSSVEVLFFDIAKSDWASDGALYSDKPPAAKNSP